MNRQEIAAVLAKVQLDDNREVTSQVVTRWEEILGPITDPMPDVLEAVNMHRRESTAYLQPAHIVANLRRIREDRAGRRNPQLESEKPPHYVPDPKPANFEAMAAAWNTPEQLKIEHAKYRAQVSEYHRQHRTGSRHQGTIRPDGAIR